MLYSADRTFFEESIVALTTLQAINAEIRQLEAQKKLVEQRDAEVPKAVTILQRYAQVLTPAQRRQVARIIGEAVAESPVRSGRGASKGRKLGRVPPKYRLPTGETWSGRGLAPRVFSAWATSAEGKAWSKANAGARFPPVSGTPAPATAAKKGVRARKKATAKRAAKTGAKTAAKRARKRAAG